ncbi:MULTISPECIES: hypothetical protein [Thermomonosporaceae]|uniref:hypothetical protein n=1 Tax=Thermomonosporaceae TaxID=2012 RepID=UPI00255AE6A4|nr:MULTISPECIES: hypothetical protein [Thermomonosporaceae]MDL4771783.1 hypothetical protein [Actinomadura xylanilytica]
MSDQDGGWRERAERRRAERITELAGRAPGRFAARRNRRLLAGAAGALLLLPWVDAAVSWLIAPSDTAVYVNLVVLAAMAVGGVPAYNRMITVTRGTTSLDERYLDERQVAERLRAFRVAHRGTTAMIIAVGVTIMLAERGRDAHVPAAANFLMVFAMLVMHIALPLIIATWRQPDPPPDDGDEEDGDGDSVTRDADQGAEH